MKPKWVQSGCIYGIIWFTQKLIIYFDIDVQVKRYIYLQPHNQFFCYLVVTSCANSGIFSKMF